MSLHVFLQLWRRLELLLTGLAGVHSVVCQFLPVLLHVYGQLAVQRELIPTLRANEVLFLLMEHNMCFETGHSRELLVAHGTNRIFCIVRTFMKCQVEFNIKGLGALVTSVWLVILLMLPHVTLKLGLFWKRQQTNFTFVEVWNWTVIINVIIIQGQNSIYKISYVQDNEYQMLKVSHLPIYLFFILHL